MRLICWKGRKQDQFDFLTDTAFLGDHTMVIYYTKQVSFWNWLYLLVDHCHYKDMVILSFILGLNEPPA